METGRIEIFFEPRRHEGHRGAQREKVISIISKIVPKALSEVSMKDAVQWSEKGDDFDKVRDELLKLL